MAEGQVFRVKVFSFPTGQALDGFQFVRVYERHMVISAFVSDNHIICLPGRKLRPPVRHCLKAEFSVARRLIFNSRTRFLRTAFQSSGEKSEVALVLFEARIVARDTH